MIDPTDTVTMQIPNLEVPWLALLRQAAATGGRGGVTRVAQRIGRSRTYVSQALNGLNKTAVSPLFIARVIDAYGGVTCPHLQTELKLSECRAIATRDWAVICGTGYEKLEQWKACQNCQHKPKTAADKTGDPA
jgi:DNA-binding transcriptional regulator YdaS (Cro superfamily)